MFHYIIQDIIGEDCKKPYLYSCECVRVLDGDTVDLEVDLGFNMKKKERFRLHGYDTPETWRPQTEAERNGGEKCKQYLIDLLKNKKLFVQSLYAGIYGRYGANLYVSNGKDYLCVNEAMQRFMDDNNLDKETLRAIKD